MHHATFVYQDDWLHSRTFSMSLKSEITAFRYYDDSEPLTLLMWSAAPLPLALVPKQLLGAHEAERQERIMRFQEEPEWGLAVFFTSDQVHPVRRMLQLLKLQYGAEIEVLPSSITPCLSAAPHHPTSIRSTPSPPPTPEESPQ